MSFASLLQEVGMVPSSLLMHTTAVVLSSSKNTFRLVLFLQKAFTQEKVACDSKDIMWHLFSIQFHLPPIFVTWSVPTQSFKLASGKIARSKGGSLMGPKASKMFLLYHFKFICCFLWDISFPIKIATRSSQGRYCITIPCNAFGHMEQLWMRTLSLLWFALVLWLLLDSLKGYSGKAYKRIVSFPQSELLSFLQSLSQTLGILFVV